MLTACARCLLLIASAAAWGLVSAQQPVPGIPAVVPAVPAEAVQEAAPEPAPPPIHHSLKVILDPQGQSITVEDTVTLPAGSSTTADFQLNSNLAITGNSGTLQTLGNDLPLRAVGINAAGVETAPATRYRIGIPPQAGNRFVISYTGRIHQQAVQDAAEYARSFSETTGIISDQGVYLNAASRWIPAFGDELVTFDLQVEFAGTAADWTAVSQGSNRGRNAWQETHPMEEVYLIAARFTEYRVAHEGVDLLAYLRTPDPNLATKYLDATERYLALYEPLLGDYPFSKFALVENFWETGYGMPSFTLLGEQIIRFPFIIDSSYPHEILHNWWGNGVYPDYGSGNWSEGLTAYLADHLFQEMNGAGAEYRKDSLIRYRNYVAEGQDFPLQAFTSRNSAATQAVGYGKTLMVWHMLRLEVGDSLFLEGLRRLYQDFKFRRASFSDIARLYSELSGRDLQPFFTQWVQRTGAPEIQVDVEQVNGNQARIMFAQIQPSEPYAMTVPVALVYAGEAEPRIYNIPLSQKVEGVMAENYSNLQAVIVDPYFDVFRKLHRAEIPPVIGQLFGAPRIMFVLPRENREQWRAMAEAFAAGVDAEIVNGEDLSLLPEDRSVWILGRDNPFSAVLQSQVAEFDVAFAPLAVTLAGSEVEYRNRATVLTASHPADSELALGWIHVDDMAAMPGMIEKLPHYGKYSYLSFTGTEPTNDVKGVWTSNDSPLLWIRPELTGFQLPILPVVPALAELPPKYLPEQLQRHVTQLADPRLQGRKAGQPGADQAASYIAQQFRDIGLQTLGGTYVHPWVHSSADTGELHLRNVIGVIPGTNRQLSARPVVLAAHYDHLGVDPVSGAVYPGADDNASGISVLIEVAAKLARSFTPQRTIIFAAFTGEENGLLGSQRFIEAPPAPYRGEDVFAMVNLDSVGRLQGRNLQIFGADSAYEWPFMAQGIGFTIGVQSTLAQQTIASSDHVSFLNAGVPAIHVFAGVHPDYHQTSDTPDKLDYAGMSDVALWVEEALVFLADRTTPLRVNLAGAAVEVSTTAGTAREASLGTVPDFAWGGPGVRVTDVTAGGAAALAGMLAGDVLLRYDDTEISSLQQYSNLLRETAPGTVVRLQILRAGQTLELSATLQAR
ncbi:MAG: hypothetical protein RLZZ385_372 [Pseudomonadota bacterium]|jgi:hypothetical protein